MKKILTLTAVLLLAVCVQAEKFITVGAIPAVASGVTTFSNGTQNVWVPKIVYTDLTGTNGQVNALVASYVPAVTTNASDTGKTYRIGSFSQVAASESVAKFNSPGDTNDIAEVVLLPGDKFTLTGSLTNLTFHRVLFEVK
jgi:hypothetical protein